MIDAINAGRVPPAFQEDLQARANELVNTVNCPRSSDEDDDDEEEPKKDKKDKEHESEGDD